MWSLFLTDIFCMLSFNHMVEQTIQLDIIFQALADSTRRDILRRVSDKALSISDLAKPYQMSFAAIAKHVKKLEAAKLISKERVGKEQRVVASPEALQAASQYLQEYADVWESRYNALDNLLENNK